MRVFFPLIALFIAGCASSFRTNPSKISVEVEPQSQRCGENDQNAHAIVRVRNGGRSVFRIWIDSGKAPPFKVSWLSYDLFKGGRISIDHGPGGHGPMPPNTLHISPGDSTTLRIPIYALQPSSYDSNFTVEIKDEEGNLYRTESFTPCVR